MNLTKNKVTEMLLPRIKEIGVNEIDFNKEVSYALQHVSKNKTLSQADGNSVLSSIINVLQVGLSLNPVLKLGYLVPRWDSLSRTNVCAFEPSYQGLIKLATDSGSVVSVASHLVYENDVFEVNYGTNENIKHNPTFKNKGEVIAVYAVATLENGNKMIEVMDISEVNEIKERSDSYKAFKEGKIKSCVWSTDKGEMSRKTVIRRLFKYIPKTEKFNKLAEAIKLDENDYSATPEQLDYIEQLLETSTISVEKNFAIGTELDTYSQSQAQSCIKYLKNNQLSPMDRGNMSAKELSQAIDDKLNNTKA